MPWSKEVIGHAVILTSPLAVCYAARVLSGFARRQDDSTSGFTSPTRSLRSLCITAEPLYRKHHEVFQYSNAAFCYQSSCDCSGDAADGDETDLDFCIITPQQALGVLGDHAPQFTKIFLNGLTFIADGCESGMVLSVDEYADLMHSAATRPRSSENSAAPSSPCLTPTAPYELEEEASACSVSPPASCRSIASTMTFLSGSERSTSNWSSLDMTPSSSLSCQRCDGPCQQCNEQAPKVCTEELPLRAASQVCDPIAMCVEPTSCEGGDAWRGLHVGLDTCRGGSKGCALDSPFGTAAGQQLAIAASCSSAASCRPPACKQARRVNSSATSATSCGGNPRRQGASGSVGSRAAPSTPATIRQHLLSAHAHVHHARHSPRLSPSEKAARRPWVPSGSRAAPPALPAPVPKAAASLPHRSTPTAYRPQAASSEPIPAGEQRSGSADPPPASSAWEDDLRQPGQLAASRPLQPVLYPRPSLSNVTVSSSPPTGLCRAPALPLPDGSVAASSVPPALRYYLAQARAAGVQQEAFVGTCSDGGAVGSSSSGVDAPRRRQTAAGLDSVGQSGFVRATVAQLNTQRLVTCHVTPFAGAKTSCKPRPLTVRGALE